MAPRTREFNSLTSQTTRRGISKLVYGTLNGFFLQGDQYPSWRDVVDGDAFRKAVPVAIDYDGSIGFAANPGTPQAEQAGLLVPPWAFLNGQKATFVAQFAGLADTCLDQAANRRVTVIAEMSGAAFNLDTPIRPHLLTKFTLADGATHLEPWTVTPTTTANLVLFRLSSFYPKTVSIVEADFNALDINANDGGAF